ncbi:MAG: molybdenum ABC transporter ATP-binding protein [Gammaproteobacteria bacterium]|nr:MAG: molybdenum ABC transporter ATP-binding protein [Gammaproteobacteria bacterium]
MSIKVKLKLVKNKFTLDVNFSIRENKITAIYGKSGSGKSTLLRCLNGLEPNTTGCFVCDDTIYQDENVFILPHKRQIATVFQDNNLFFHKSVMENLEYGYKRVSKADIKIKIKDIINDLQLENLLTKKPAMLSGGEQSQIAIARALLSSPKILLLDETLSSIDIKKRENIIKCILKVPQKHNITIVFISHNIQEVSQIADDLVLMDNGKIITYGKTAKIFANDDIYFAQSDETSVIIKTEVAKIDKKYAISYLGFSGGMFQVARTDLNMKQKIRLRIVAKDVSLATAYNNNTSILNIFKARVTNIKPAGLSQKLIKLKIADDEIFAKITNKSAGILSLKINKQVYVQIKSVALFD